MDSSCQNLVFDCKKINEGFPHSSVPKESACNAGDRSSIPGSGRSAGEGIGYPLQYSWASLVALLVKKLPAMHNNAALNIESRNLSNDLIENFEFLL